MQSKPTSGFRYSLSSHGLRTDSQPGSNRDAVAVTTHPMTYDDVMATTDLDPSDGSISDWATEFDHTHPEYGARAPEIWDDLRDRCPIAHSEAFGGTWLPVRHEDVAAIAADTDHFTSRGVVVGPERPSDNAPVGEAPPITSDPPFHSIARRLLLPGFTPKSIAPWESSTREICNELIDDILESLDGATGDDRVIDAAVQYAQDIPVMVIADMLGVPKEDGDIFRGFIHRIIENPGGDDEVAEEHSLDFYLDRVIEEHARADTKRGDLIDYLLELELEGNKLEPEHVRGTVALLLIAGIDTTWSAIGASLWHLAGHDDDRRRLVNEPALMDTAVEELLRFYAPVTMARLVAKDIEFGGCPMKAEDWVLLPFPAANRDPEAFENADEFVIDRARNRHSAFGLGIHRCIGSNLARMELRVALEEWLKRIPEFNLVEPDTTRWSAGQIRGPRELPVRVL